MRIHNDDKNYKCEECGKQFKRKGTLNSHLETHNEVGKYSCDICQKNFKLLNNLKQVGIPT